MAQCSGVKVRVPIIFHQYRGETGATSNVYATLVPYVQYGSISVTSLPVGASLYVDTIYQGYTNQIVGNLAVGTPTP